MTCEDLQVTQADLQKGQIMSAAEGCVSDASIWASSCVASERERGEEDPIATVARRARVSRNAIWSLLYRPPKRVAADVYLALGSLYERECARQAERYAAERAVTQAKTRIGQALLRASDRLSGQKDGSVI